MKSFFKNRVLALLVLLARIRVRRLKPLIIGITGSMGKTSTKDALFTILQTRSKVLRSEKSYNTEFGLPLAILQQSSGFSSSWDWLRIIFYSLGKVFFGGKDFEMLVLEMGVDKPGDMDFLLNVVRPQIGVLTSIKPVHLGAGQFKNTDDILHEKSKLLTGLPHDGTAILNFDDEKIALLVPKLRCKVITYGMNEKADLRVVQLASSAAGIDFEITYQGQNEKGHLKVLGRYQIYVVLPAIAAALQAGFGLKEAVSALEAYRLPPGRMSMIRGIRGSIILDSSYNASPEAMKSALDLLMEIKGKRRIAVLGGMNELGDESARFHAEIGGYAAQRANVLVTVGEVAKKIVEGALIAGMPKECLHAVDDVEAASKFMVDFIQADDLILVKGSQNNVRLEKLVKAIMEDPSLADKLLVRQEKQWQNP